MIERAKSPRRVYLIVFASYVFAFVNEAAVCRSATIFQEESASRREESWLGSIFVIGIIFGLIFYGYCACAFGRRYTLLSLGFLEFVAIASFIIDGGSRMKMLYLGRFLIGVGTSMTIVVFPMYVAEICNDSDRGLLLVSREIFTSAGVLFASFTEEYLPLICFDAVLCALLLFYIVYFLKVSVESPYFYAMINDFPSAKKALIELNDFNNREAEEEVDEVSKAIGMMSTQSMRDKKIRTAVLLVYTVFIFQSLTGYIPFTMYLESILPDVDVLDYGNIEILTGVIFLIGSISSTCLVDKKGRKILLCISLIGIIIVEALFSLYYFYNGSVRFLPVLYLMLFFLFYNFGISYFPQIICAEILPLNMKFKVATFAGIAGSCVGLLVATSYLDAMALIGNGWIILGFSFCTFVFLIIVVFFLPETKGRSFRQIHSMLETQQLQQIMYKE